MQTKQVRFLLPERVNLDLPIDSEQFNVYLHALFREKSLGFDTKYNQLLQALEQENGVQTSEELGRLPPKQVLLLIKALSLFVTSLDQKVQPLVNSILKIEWLNQDPEFIKAYLHLLQNIVSAQSLYITPVCQMLVQCIVDAPTRYPFMPSFMLFEQLHGAIATILALIPSGPSCILPILAKQTPHKSDSEPSIEFYIQSLLYIGSYSTILQNDVFAIVIDLLVEIDADIDYDELDFENEDIFEMDDVENDNTEETLVTDEYSDADSLTLIKSDQRRMIAKLDQVLQVVFKHIQLLPKKENEVGLNNLFYCLLDIFERRILPTHKLHSVQFLVFYTCSIKPQAFAEDFMGMLVTVLMNNTNSMVIRMYAASYLGSYISRANYIDIGLVRQSLKIMNQLCVGFLQEFEKSLKNRVQVEKYGVLYATIQAILYIYCFRWKQIMSVEGLLKTDQFPIELGQFQMILYSKFQPLRVCSQSIVDEFARITHHLNIMYCYPLINGTASANRLELVLPKNSEGKPCRIDAYFPFDPIYLPKCKVYIQELYQEWDGNDQEEYEPTESDLSNSIQGMSLDSKTMSSSFLQNSLQNSLT